MYDWDFSAIGPFWPALRSGLWVTVRLSLTVIAVATVVGFALGYLLRIPIAPLRWLLLLAVDILRSIPVLVLLLMANYFLPDALGWPRMSSFIIATIVLTTNLAVFIGDVVRGALGHIPRGELDAARAIGLPEWRVATRFVLPALVRLVLPTLTLLYIATVKNSALASVIAVYDIAHVAGQISTLRYRTLEAFLAMTGLYLVVIMPLTLLSRRLESALVDRSRAVAE